MTINFDKIKETKSKIINLLLVTSLSGIIYSNFIKNDYQVFNENDISKIENKIPTKNTYDEIIKKVELSDKDNIVITFDGVNDSSHAKNVKGIIDNTLNDNNIENIDSIYMPKILSFKLNEDYKDIYKNINTDKKYIDNSDQRQYLEVLNQYKEYNNAKFDNYVYDQLSKIDKNIYINESFGVYIKFNHKKTSMNLKTLDLFTQNLNDLDDKAKNKIEFLNQNPNIKIITAAGNNFYYELDTLNLKSNVILKDMFDKLTNNDYNKTKELSIVLNEIIEEYRKNSTVGLKYFDNFKNELKDLFEEKKINPDALMSFFIQDYLIHYEKLALLKNEDKLINNNLFILEAENQGKVLKNYDDYKKYHNKTIPDLDEYFTTTKELYIKLVNNEEKLDRHQIKEFKEFVEKYEDKYPEIFKYTNHGTFNNFGYHESNILKRSVEGHNGSGFIGLSGTSFAAPEYTASLIINEIKQNQHEIERN